MTNLNSRSEAEMTKLAALANAPTLALPAVAAAAPRDPVFAAMKRHSVAYAAFGASLGEEEEALSDLIATVPTTIAGMRAWLKYLIEFEGGAVVEGASNSSIAGLRRSPSRGSRFTRLSTSLRS